MKSRIIDTNVPLTAAGLNTEASKRCQAQCVMVLERIFSGSIKVVLDDKNEVLREYRTRMHPKHKGTLADRFILHMLQYQVSSDHVDRIMLPKNESTDFLDYPDRDGNWTSDVPRCERFDPDDKKWVALAVRFKQQTGIDAPIVNAADRCWLAFEPHLQASGVKLETLCREERQKYG